MGIARPIGHLLGHRASAQSFSSRDEIASFRLTVHYETYSYDWVNVNELPCPSTTASCSIIISASNRSFISVTSPRCSRMSPNNSRRDRIVCFGKKVRRPLEKKYQNVLKPCSSLRSNSLLGLPIYIEWILKCVLLFSLLGIVNDMEIR